MNLLENTNDRYMLSASASHKQPPWPVLRCSAQPGYCRPKREDLGEACRELQGPGTQRPRQPPAPSPTAMILHFTFSPGLELRGSLCCNKGGETVTWAGAQHRSSLPPPGSPEVSCPTGSAGQRLYSERLIEHSGLRGQARL